MHESWEREISLEDIPVRQRELAETLGVPAYLDLMRKHGGTYTYIPKADELLRTIRNRHIREEYNGYNLNYLAVKYGLSTISIRAIVQSSEGSQQVPGQTSLLDGG